MNSLPKPQNPLLFSPPNPSSSAAAPMDSTESSLRQSLAAKQAAVDAQANAVRELKASSAADKSAVAAAVDALKALKIEKSSIEEELQSLVKSSGGESKEAFRQAVTNTLERKLFYVPSFKIYGGVAGLYDYGPPGCAVKQNVLAFWRQVLANACLLSVLKFELEMNFVIVIVVRFWIDFIVRCCDFSLIEFLCEIWC